MKCAIYVRVSTEEQAREGYSIEAQKKELTNHANLQNWTIHGLYVDDGYSAKDLNRPEFQNMMSKIEEFDVLLIYKIDRISRSLVDLEFIVEILQKHNVAFKSLKEEIETVSASGRMMFRIFGVFAQYERENISERARFGMVQMVSEGKRAGARVPFGFNRDGTIHEQEADVLRKMFEMYLSGKGFKAIATYLNQEQMYGQERVWSHRTVKYTLDNPIYYGILRYGKKNERGTYNVNLANLNEKDFIFSESPFEQIFTKEEYEKYKEFRVAKSKSGYKERYDYWFRGVLICGKCGQKMYGKLSGYGTYYYACSLRLKDNSCEAPSIRQIHIEKLFLDYLKNLIVIKEDIAKKKVSIKKNENQIMIKQALEKIEAKRKKLLEIYLADEITRDEFLELKNDLEVNERELLLQLEAPQKEIDVPLITNVSEIWEELSDRDRNEVVQNIVESITLHAESNPKGNRFSGYFHATIEIKMR